MIKDPPPLLANMGFSNCLRFCKKINILPFNDHLCDKIFPPPDTHSREWGSFYERIYIGSILKMKLYLSSKTSFLFIGWRALFLILSNHLILYIKKHLNFFIDTPIFIVL